MGLIHDAYIKGIKQEFDRRPQDILYVSDLGYHPRQAMQRILQGSKPNFPDDTLERMRNGVIAERDTLDTAGQQLGGMIRNVPIYNDLWSGEMDAVIGHGLAGLTPIIIEHKLTTEKGWSDRSSVIKATHVCQLWMYGELYLERFKVKPQLILYYRAHGHFMELQIERVEVAGDYRMFIHGDHDGDEFAYYAPFDPALLRIELQGYFISRSLPPEPLDARASYPEKKYKECGHQS